MTDVVHGVQSWLIQVPAILSGVGAKVVAAISPASALWPAVVLALASVTLAFPSVQLHKLEKRVLPWAAPGWQAPTPKRIRVAELMRRGNEVVAARRMTAGLATALSLLVLLATSRVGAALVAGASATAATTLIARTSRDFRATQQRRSIRYELATVTDFLALAVSAGLSVESALTRVPSYFRGVIAENIESREPSARAMDVLRTLAQHNSDTRGLLDALTVCEATGAPTAQVLHEQAQSAANRVRADALASAGRREVLMLIPVVLFVFPAVVLVAIFPGWQELHSSGW